MWIILFSGIIIQSYELILVQTRYSPGMEKADGLAVTGANEKNESSTAFNGQPGKRLKFVFSASG